VAVSEDDPRSPFPFLGTEISRAEFLKGGGAMLVGFSFAGAIVGSASSTALAASSPRALAASAKPALTGDLATTPSLDAWLAVRQNNTVELYQSKVELGEGEITAMQQICAEELYLPFESVIMIRTETDVTPFDGGTYGSGTVTGGGAAVRVAAATAREALLALAAKKLGVPVSRLAIKNGVISVGRKSVTYGALIGGKRFDMKASPTAPLKPVADYTIVGQSIPRVDLAQKLTGADGPHQYLVNKRVANMVHARMMRPPAFGATIKSMDTSKVEKMPGVVAIVPLTFGPKMVGWQKVWAMPEGEFVGVVAETENQALDALEALEAATTWTSSATLPTIKTTEDSANYLHTIKPVNNTIEGTTVGKPASVIASAPKKLDAHYATPYVTNGPIGPGDAIADVTKDGATIWSGSQVPFSVQPAVAAVLGLPASKVTVVQYDAPGSYGRGNLDDVAIDAALLSQKVGRPVRAQWMRQEEFIWTTQKTPMSFHLQGGVSESGKILGWQSEIWSDTHLVNIGFYFGATYGGAVLPIYEGAHETRVHYVPTALRKGAMRGLGGYPTVFAHESFIDELAYLAGLDPVEFRLKNLNDPRAIAVIEEAVKLAGWTSHTKPRATGVGQGICFMPDGGRTYVCQIATVSVDKSSGQVTVKHIAVAHDAGLMINPNTVQNQVQGGTLQGTSWTLHEQLTFNNETVTSVDWLSYPILRYEEVPKIDIKLISRPEVASGGVGEASAMAIGAAIGNAFYDATGVRMRATPFTPARVKALLG
jgi:nicotinate dehydrogenase subunit B